MDDTQLDDLKQFITATISQTEQRLSDHIDTLSDRVDTLSDRVDSLDSKMDDGFGGIAEAVESMHSHHDDTIAAHDARLRKLEKKAA